MSIPSSRLSSLLLAHLHRGHPYKSGHVFADGETSADPAILSPVFRGSFDWHSSVHSHWALVRLIATGGGGAPEAARLATSALETSFASERVAGELDQLDRPHRRGFELPYGMAWLLTLGAEVAAAAELGRWSKALAPLIELARERFAAWITALPAPIRTGEHSQSAFAMTLALDAARVLGDADLARVIEARARDFYAADADAPISWEPSAFDFVSPALAEADLMRRVLAADFARWFDAYLPRIELSPVTAADRDDGKLAHADGLNWSRGWMLANLAAHRPSLDGQSRAHLEAGRDGLEAASYAGTHWLPSFAVYALFGSAGRDADK